jgi:putative transposase
MRCRLFVHIVWTTRNREPTLNSGAATFLAAYLPAVAQQERSLLLALGIVRTHVHVIAYLQPSTDIPRLVQRMKGGSAAISNKEGRAGMTIRWAKGYSIQSVSPRALKQAQRYVTEQAKHHPDEGIAGWTGWEPQDAPVSAASAVEPSSGFQPLETAAFRKGAVPAPIVAPPAAPSAQ